MECWLLNAAHLHHVPGRKTDVADAARIAQLVEHAPGPPQLRAAPPGPRVARADPLPQDPDPAAQPGGPAARQGPGRTPGPELSSVATDVVGVLRPGDAGSPGGRHPRPGGAGALAKGRLRSKLPALREALAGRFRTDHHGLLVAQILAHIEDLDETIAALSARIQQVIGPFAEQVALLDTNPRGRPARRRRHPGRDRPGHGPVPHRGPPRLLGAGGVRGTTSVGRQASVGADP
jgi:transposase